MTSPNELRSARDSYAVVLRGIIREFEIDSSQVFMLFEGKDGEFYRPRIGMAFAGISARILYKNCKGKTNLKKLMRAIFGNNKIKCSRCLFFFDRDYEHDLAEISLSNCYITDGYSIENYYSSKEAVSAAIRGILFADAVHTEEEEELVSNLLTRFQALQTECHRALALFNAWAWVQRHTPRPGRIDLDRFDALTRLSFEIYSGTVTFNYTLQDLNNLAPDRAPVTEGEITIALTWFADKPAQRSFRGKQEADIVYKFFQWSIENISKGVSPFIDKRKVARRVSRKELVADLSTYADSPTSLSILLGGYRTLWFS